MSSPSSSLPVPSAEREVLSFDPGWRFHLGDIPFPEITGHGSSYGNAKAGSAGGAAGPGFDDTEWRIVDLPHDWAVESPFDPKGNLAQGYRPRGIGWYRKNFALPVSDRGRHLELLFEGIATNATVWINGTVVHRNHCGYTGFSIDLTPFARFGDERNTIAIRVDAVAQEGWWYEGAGIYRQTRLIRRSAVHLATDGVFAQPVRSADGSWSVPVEATVGNSTPGAVEAVVRCELVDPDDAVVSSGEAIVTIATCDTAVARLALAAPATPRRWSVDAPTLYRVRTTVTSASGVDATETTCGFRTIRFDATHGFFLNDQPLKLKGTCNHQDHAGVGVAIPPALWEWRVRRLKELGSNAYRCAHNPPARELLDACDRHGILVMDENRHFNCAPEYLGQLEWLVRRDRNHPCVILWSVFNEEPQQGTEVGYEMVRRMAALVKRLDPTRPVTAAMNGGLDAPINVSQAVDVVGFNYQTWLYDAFHAAHPEQPCTSAEDTSAFMTRGEWTTDKAANRMGCYDDNPAPWGNTHRDAWQQIAKRPFLAGGFVWTGFDYRGEPTPHEWPSAGSFFGIMDLCGFPKAAYFIHQAAWIDDRPLVKILPHWNWSGREGDAIRVTVASNAERVALVLNGAVIGEQPVDRLEQLTWQVPFVPGRLEAIAYRGGDEVARDVVETTGPAVALRLVPDRVALQGDGVDALPVTIEAVDAQGRMVPTANPLVVVALDGAGRNLGLGNGDPNCHEPEKADRHTLFHGLGQVIVGSMVGGAGDLRIRATAEGLAPAEVAIRLEPAVAPPAIPAAGAEMYLWSWRMSPITPTRPDPTAAVADSDQNSWTGVWPGWYQDFPDGGWAIYRTTFTPYATQRRAGGIVRLRQFQHAAEAWVDGRQVAFSIDGSGALVVPFPAGEGIRTVSVLAHASPGSKAGLGGPCSVREG